ncbi:ABC transporter ATP-binding protein [Kaistia dalseonensis]|uniref:ATP-binding cassette subfamily B multidrug efflux pump n=1 Tax=Kaistia dalseonensis TaxID=410840 RepID=A0ABU0H6Y0_9HYPH|nr:ABC transporter ATP-binding protein [Kaistia dalseonensis]MCX5495202.1 ABC transporter ATP-binding protein [Kaistia dalseonensis]MDQ0437787.1 ATP-binding cassette subfamily B multidrug efflux pump [Kaistia dalseonensis]
MFRFFENLIDPFRAHDETMPPATLLGFYWRYCRQVWPYLLALMAVGLVVSLIEISMLRYIGSIVDLLKATSPTQIMADYGPTFLWMGFVILIARPIAQVAHDLLNQQAIAPSFTNMIRWQTHHYVMRQSITFFANDFAGRIASKIVQTGPALRESVVQVIDALWFVTIFAGSALVIFWSADWRLAMPLIGWILAYVTTLVYFVPRIRDRATIMSEMRSLVTGRIVDSYTNVQTVKLFAHPDREDEYAKESLVQHTETFRSETRLITLMNATVSTLNGILVVGTGALAIWLWSMNDITLGAIALASGLAIRITNMSGWIMWVSIGIFEQMGTVQEGLETIARPYALLDKPDARDLVADKGEIRFDNVRFHYGKKGGIIEDLSFTIKPGEKVGLVGRSGAGKSTLVNLLLRFYDVESGQILIDGQNVSNVRQDSLRRQIGLVTQDTSLLHRSVRDNILYGMPNATEAEVVEATHQAHAAEFIGGLSDPHGRIGLDAHVGERGVKLSGGQRQRIAIARVLLKDAPILILDEATSALDSEVEAAIQESFFRLMAGKTVIAIAHRLSTIAAMDRLIVLDKGHIVETGSHEELLRQNGLYASLWRRQSGGFLDLDAA